MARVTLHACVTQPVVSMQEALPIPSQIRFGVGIACTTGSTVRLATAWVINSRGRRVSPVAVCQRASGFTCLALGSYRPALGGFTRVLALRGSVVMVAKIRGAVWTPFTTKRTIEHCVGFLTPILYCGWTDRFVTPDHRCDLTPPTRSFPAINAEMPYPTKQNPLAPFVDGRGRIARLFWGRTKQVLPTEGFWDGYGYEHIAAKHGWGPADEAATRIAIRGRPVKTESTTITRRMKRRKAKVRLVTRVYVGPRYSQNSTRCERVVVITWPARAVTGGTIISSYGAVDESGSSLEGQS